MVPIIPIISRSQVNIAARPDAALQPGLVPVVRVSQITVQSAVNFTSFSIAVCVLFHRLQFGNYQKLCSVPFPSDFNQTFVM
jgi:hypothetical protein